jgi:hypothetical protein
MPKMMVLNYIQRQKRSIGGASYLVVSSANDDMVVNDPQNPVIKREYLVSKFHNKEIIENTPKIKLPMILTISTLAGSAPANIIGDDAILYRRNAPAKAPIDRNAISSIPLIVI